MGDTHEHSAFITDVFAQYGSDKISKLDIPRFLSMIKDDQYALTKIDSPYMVTNFPIDYPVGKDLDDLVSAEYFYAVIAKLIKPLFIILPNRSDIIFGLSLNEVYT